MCNCAIMVSDPSIDMDFILVHELKASLGVGVFEFMDIYIQYMYLGSWKYIFHTPIYSMVYIFMQFYFVTSTFLLVMQSLLDLETCQNLQPHFTMFWIRVLHT